MDGDYKQVFFPKTLPELFASWGRFPDAVPFGGGTELAKEQEKKHTLALPGNIISLDRIPDLRVFTRTERYIEAGSMVKLSDILNVERILPSALAQAIKGIGSPEVRNLATIGGNICGGNGGNPPKRLDTAAPLIALDARFEIRSAQNAWWTSASRFYGSSGPTALRPQELLTRIRIPLEQWDYTLYKKFETQYMEYEYGGSAVFLVRIRKNILTDIRLVFAGSAVLRDKDSETALAGKRLPLDKRDAANFVELWESNLAEEGSLPRIMQAKMLGIIENGLRDLSS